MLDIDDFNYLGNSCLGLKKQNQTVVITYPNEKAAMTAFHWLTKIMNKFEDTPVYAYGEIMNLPQFWSRFLSVVKKAGYETELLFTNGMSGVSNG